MLPMDEQVVLHSGQQMRGRSGQHRHCQMHRNMGPAGERLCSHYWVRAGLCHPFCRAMSCSIGFGAMPILLRVWLHRHCAAGSQRLRKGTGVRPCCAISIAAADARKLARGGSSQRTLKQWLDAGPFWRCALNRSCTTFQWCRVNTAAFHSYTHPTG